MSSDKIPIAKRGEIGYIPKLLYIYTKSQVGNLLTADVTTLLYCHQDLKSLSVARPLSLSLIA